MYKVRGNQEGAASFIVVIFLAIILSVLTIAFVRLSINEQRDASDDDLTKRAYYAAESGTEDAKRAIDEYLSGALTIDELNAEECAPPDPYNPVLNDGVDGFDVEYTCQQIDLEPNRYYGEIKAANSTVTVPINPVDDAGVVQPLAGATLTLRWHMNDTVDNNGDGVLGGGSDQFALASATNRNLYTVNEWVVNRRYPAMLRTNFFGHNRNVINSSDVTDPDSQRVAFIYPNQDSSSPQITIANNLPADIGTADCRNNGTGSFLCEKEFVFSASTPANFIYYLRLSSLYRGTHFELTLEDSGGDELSFKDAQAVIDVTARAADVYRRVRSEVTLNNFAELPNEALTSLDAICKNFSVTDDPVDFSGPKTGPRAGSSCE